VDLLDLVEESGLLRAGRAVVVLLSGGRDSVCLLDLAVRIGDGTSVAALHVNYRLRATSEEDERFCAGLCDRLGVPLEIVRPASPAKGNLQAWARGKRYQAAAALARSLDADVAAGHTATDQVETILYRLASSPSRRALLGMRPREPLPREPSEPLPLPREPLPREPREPRKPQWLVRPLLSVSRAQTAAYCRERGLEWREDETNESDAFARGRVRATLVPALRSIHPAAEDNVLALAEILRDEADVLDELVGEVLADGAAVPLERLRVLPPALARLVVQRLADDAAGAPAPGTARRLSELLRMPDQGRAALDLPHGVRAIAERGMLRFVRR
jgi:tRNA(Ile)-lysidine synthase